MTMIRPETEMKDSGVQWIGDIPNDWDVRRLKYVLNERKEKNDPLVTDNIVSLSAEQGVIPFSERIGGGNKPKEDLTAYKVVRAGDIVLNSMNVLSGAVHYSNYTGCVSPVYYMLYNENDVITRYYNLVFQTEAFQRSLRGLGNGILIKETDEGKLNTIRMRIPMEKLNKVKLPSPSFDEMKKVVEFIEPIRSKIDEIIAEAKASIDEYKELKQSVIFEAVTKGLDKNINVYKTGNSWIPSLPVGIKLSRFGLHHDIILGKMLCPNPRNEEDTLEPYYCAANVHFDGVTGVLKTMWFNSKEKETYVVHKNDMLIVEGGAGAGGAAIMNEEPPVSTFVQNSIMIVRSHMKDNRYSCYLVQALVKNKYVDVVCNKATIPHFTKEKVSYMPYPVFNRNERNEIANYLDERCKQIDSLIAEKQSLIADLEAYKKSLIFEVVTGKRRVV